jgi:stage III sporulation protein AE
MWDRGIVGKLSELFAFLASWEIKICAFLFVGSLTLGRMGAGSTSAVVGKGMKLAVGSVPVVGNLFENSLETVAGCITALKGSTAVALIIIIALASAAKLIKLCVVMLLYKLTAALTEPMGNKKITEMLDCAGEGIKLLIAAYFTVIIMFVTAVSVMLGSFG